MGRNLKTNITLTPKINTCRLRIHSWKQDYRDFYIKQLIREYCATNWQENLVFL